MTSLTRPVNPRAAKAIRLGIYLAHIDPLGFLTTADYKRLMGSNRFYELSADAYQRTYERLAASFDV